MKCRYQKSDYKFIKKFRNLHQGSQKKMIIGKAVIIPSLTSHTFCSEKR